MKELEKHIAEKTEVHATKPVKKEIKYISTLKPQKGQRVFELNLATGIINEATFKIENEVVDFKKAVMGDMSVRRRLQVNKDCIYCCALNPQNADKRFHKMLNKPYKKK